MALRARCFLNPFSGPEACCTLFRGLIGLHVPQAQAACLPFLLQLWDKLLASDTTLNDVAVALDLRQPEAISK
jgi:hypothetical protein